MSAEVLREAAETIRVDYAPAAGFHQAVADWLDAEAHWWEHGSSSPGSLNSALIVARAYLATPENKR